MFKKLLYDVWNLCTKCFEHIETIDELFENKMGRGNLKYENYCFKYITRYILNE